MYMSLEPLNDTSYGVLSTAVFACPPSPLSPDVPEALPATV